jgi:hypothetical protein
MAPLGALSRAWVSAEASLPRGWRIVGVLRRERAMRLLPAVSDVARPDWCALAEDEALVLYDAWAGHEHQALDRLADPLRELRGPATG